VSPLSTKFVCIGAGTFGVPFGPFALALGAGRLGALRPRRAAAALRRRAGARLARTRLGRSVEQVR
jgi:hypothetical protein